MSDKIIAQQPASGGLPSETVENYLKALFHLGGHGQELVRTKELAEHLEISLPSATNMVKALAERGLVQWQPYRGAALTEEGRRAALKVIRKHRLIEVFLVRSLGMSWDEVHIEAELLEHAISDKLVERIDQVLGRPRTDPHGDPIPEADGTLVVPEGMWLTEAEAGTRLRLIRVADQESKILRYLESRGLVPGAEFSLVEFEPFDGPLHIRTEDRDTWLSWQIAARLLVDTVEPAGR